MQGIAGKKKKAKKRKEKGSKGWLEEWKKSTWQMVVT